MAKFKCSYAYDVPHYYDFVVEANSEDEAQEKARIWLASVTERMELTPSGTECIDNMCNERVFTDGEVDQFDDVLPILDHINGTFNDQEA